MSEAVDSISFAQAATEESSSANYSYGFVAAGLVAAGVYLYSQKNQKKEEMPLVDKELEFSLV